MRLFTSYVEVEFPSSKLRQIVSKVIVRKIPAPQSVRYGKEKTLGSYKLGKFGISYFLLDIYMKR